MKSKTDLTIDPRLVDAVLFDLDGVVTDTATVHEATWAELFDELYRHRIGHPGEDHRPLDHDDYLRHLDGKPRRAGLHDFLAARRITLPQGQTGDDGYDSCIGLETRKQYAFARRLAAGIEAMPPTAALVAALASAGIKTAVFSSSRNCRQVLRAARLADSFDAVLDGNDTERLGLRPKPAADLLLEAARQLNVRPERCVVVEDARVGVAAGRAGGFATIIGIAPTGSGDALRELGADVVVPDLTHVVVANSFESRHQIGKSGRAIRPCHS
jgi:HAD superfamily hydrolase (TIGR01509 family)